ncbi:restriction endonuclease subunit S [Enterococcus faecium]|uniref:restriction endonuclease subunit S n=1 Tax=Enterococcus faecium TaxID=1352 RepID=UPI00100E103C|nr:restriction endonuclease subunit S [Enterococcus faecium]RXW46881.1 type I restriction endonuclease subunit S [Enterococcus faecium]
MSKDKQPEIRFPGFTDEWEERKVGEIFKVTRGQVLAATETSESITEKNIYPVYSSQTKNDGLMGYYSDYLFDTAITWTTDGANAGTVNYRNGKFYSTNVNGVLLSDKGYANKAVAEIINRIAWKHVSKVGNPKLMNNVMSEITITIPSVEEQETISRFFTQLDSTITLHERELDLLKETKKGFLQKMFPKNGAKVPEIRFPGFTEDWEQRKLGQVANYRRGSFPQPYGNKEWYDGENSMPFVQVVDVGDNLRLVEDTKQKISELAQPKSVFVEEGKVVVTLQGSIGRVAITQYPAYVDRTLLIFESYKAEMDEYYFAYVIQQLFEYEKTRAPGGTIKTITKEALSNFTISFPSIAEQKKLGKFFEQLDDTIALHQRKLDLLKETKKGFLQKMFV